MAVRLAPPDIETFIAGGNTFRVIDDGETTGGRIGIVECRLDPGWPGPPQHLHHEHDETFFVLEGRVRFASGDQSFVVEPGQFVTVPLGDPHTFGNADDSAPARLLCSVSPARFIDFFREFAQLTASGRPDPAAVHALMKA